MKLFKKLRFYSEDEQQILEAVSIFKKLGYRVVDGYFNINEAKEHGGVCVWDDREITEGYLESDDFKQVTLSELKGVVVDKSKDVFTPRRLLGCEVSVVDPFGEKLVGYITDKITNSNVYEIDFGGWCDYYYQSLLTFFTEDGDELTFDEYVAMYYGE